MECSSLPGSHPKWKGEREFFWRGFLPWNLHFSTPNCVVTRDGIIYSDIYILYIYEIGVYNIDSSSMENE